jgi:hypothetical protein
MKHHGMLLSGSPGAFPARVFYAPFGARAWIPEIYEQPDHARAGEVAGIRSVPLDVTDRPWPGKLPANEVTERERLAAGVTPLGGGA